MLHNWVKRTVMQDSTIRKFETAIRNIRPVMLASFDSLTKNCLPWRRQTKQNYWLYSPVALKKRRRDKKSAHATDVQSVNDGVWYFSISDIRSVKSMTVTTVSVRHIRSWASSSFSRIVSTTDVVPYPGEKVAWGAIYFLINNFAKCWPILKIFAVKTSQ